MTRGRAVRAASHLAGGAPPSSDRRTSCSWRWLLVLGLGACTAGTAVRADGGSSPGVGHFVRPPGMPIGTGASGGEIDELDAPSRAADSPAVSAAVLTNNAGLAIPKFEAAPAAPPITGAPCAGCVALEVDVSDINQRDEFAFDVDGARVTRVVWTILVTFNSDQLAVQPFVDGKRGKYTSLHVNTFPLRTPVEVEQEFKGKAKTVGLVVGSSGAWTGNQTMSVFVDSVRVEGAHPFTKSFATGTEGLAPRTHARNPNVVFHPEQ